VTSRYKRSTSGFYGEAKRGFEANAARQRLLVRGPVRYNGNKPREGLIQLSASRLVKHTKTVFQRTKRNRRNYWLYAC